jgi:2-iminobutanoate/2-iminopropanoate deaminase
LKTQVQTKLAPAAIGPYSQGIKAGGLVFVSGQIPLDASGQTMAEGVAAQTQRALENLAAILAAEGLGLEHVVKTTVFMADLGQFAAMNEVYARYFKAPFPARETVGVAALPKGAGVEISAIAWVGPA